MYYLYPKVKKIIYTDGYFDFNKKLSVFFSNKEVNVFTKLASFLDIEGTRDKENADILFEICFKY